MSNYPMFFNHTRREYLHGQMAPSDWFKHDDRKEYAAAAWHLFNIFWGDSEDKITVVDESAFGHDPKFAEKVKDYTSVTDEYEEACKRFPMELLNMVCEHCGAADCEQEKDECWDAEWVPTKTSLIRATPHINPPLFKEGTMSETRFKFGKCTATTKKGAPCKSGATNEEGLCGPHRNQVYEQMAKEEVQMKEEKNTRWPGRYIVSGTGASELQEATPEVKKAVYQWILAKLSALLAIHGDQLRVMSGMAEGFDKALAKAAIQLNIPLVLVIPNQGYGPYYWGRKSRTGKNNLEEFKAIVGQASHVYYVKEDVYKIDSPGVYLNVEEGTASWSKGRGLVHSNFIRNQVMVDWADEFLVYNSNSRGTADCVRRIKEANLPFEEYGKE